MLPKQAPKDGPTGEMAHLTSWEAQKRPPNENKVLPNEAQKGAPTGEMAHLTSWEAQKRP